MSGAIRSSRASSSNRRSRMSHDQPQLDYAPPSPWHRRRSARRVLSICFLTLAAAFVLHWSWQIANRVKANHYFSKCLTYSASSEQPAYLEHMNDISDGSTTRRFFLPKSSVIAPPW